MTAMRPEVLTFDQYCERRGVPSHAPSEAGLHTRGHMSHQAHRRALASIQARHAAWQADRDRLAKEYEAALTRGDVRAPTRLERLRATATGHPDLPSVQAAKRILARIETDMENSNG